jgi:hypothetical protein
MCTTPSFLLANRDAVSVHAVFERLGVVSSFPISVKGAPAPVNGVSARLHCSLSCCGSVSLRWNRPNNHGSTITSYTVTAQKVDGLAADNVLVLVDDLGSIQANEISLNLTAIAPLAGLGAAASSSSSLLWNTIKLHFHSVFHERPGKLSFKPRFFCPSIVSCCM